MLYSLEKMYHIQNHTETTLDDFNFILATFYKLTYMTIYKIIHNENYLFL